MESVLDKETLRKQIRNNMALHSKRTIPQSEAFHVGNIILALIEIREAIEEGLERLDHTHIEAAMMLVGCKESFDTFLEHRIKSDKVLSDVLAKVQGHPIDADSQPLQAAAEVALDAIATANAGKKAARSAADKVLENTVAAANSGKVPEKDEKPDTPPAEENKSSVTLKLGDLDKIPSDSGIE